MLLRAVDPEDRPGALDEYGTAVEAAPAAYERSLRYGPYQGRLCPHGQPAGAVPSPQCGRLACRACRASSDGSAGSAVGVAQEDPTWPRPAHRPGGSPARGGGR